MPADIGVAKDRPPPRPADFPAVDLVAEQFTFRGKPLGRVELVASRSGEDWRIERATMVNPQASLNGSGTWRRRAAHRRALRARSRRRRRVLDAVGYPGLVKERVRACKAALLVAGRSRNARFRRWQGVQMQAEEGQFLEIEPGIGKLISLMSLQALPKRITLDFRDVFSKGFQFDRIAANAQLDAGVMKLSEFRMRGSAAEVEMTGETDLARETQNLRVRVVPSLGDSAALGITIVNPVAGVAAAIAQRILKNPLGQIFSYDYEVSGTWTVQRWRRSCHRRYRTSRFPTDAASSRCGDSDGFGAEVAANLAAAARLIAEAARAGAKLAALPENFYLIGRHEGDKVAARPMARVRCRIFRPPRPRKTASGSSAATPISSEDDKRVEARAWSTTTPGGGLRATTRCISSDSIMKPSATTRRAPCRPAQRRSPCKAPSDGSRFPFATMCAFLSSTRARRV